MKRQLLLLLLAITVAGPPNPAGAYEVITSSQGAEIKWALGAASFAINPAGGPVASVEAIEQALQVWSVSGGFIQFTYTGPTTRGVSADDLANVCCFSALGSNGILARNSFLYLSQSGHLLDSDIVFNTSYPWSATREPDAFDVGNIATHELGHSLALNDLYDATDSEKTMYGYGTAEEIKKKTLDPDDIAGLVHLYPAPGSLTVTLSPAEAVGAGAQWSLDVGGWNGAGETLSITPGQFPVTFRPVSGFTTPDGQMVTISSARSTTLTATYTPIRTASLRVTLLPEAVCTAGAQWRLDEGAWNDSGARLTVLDAGAHRIAYKAATGYSAPDSETITITAGTAHTLTREYTVQQTTGALTVLIRPDEAIRAGARWRVDGGDWRASGSTLPGLTAGSHSVSFNSIAGFTPPAPFTVPIRGQQTTTAEGIYAAGDSGQIRLKSSACVAGEGETANIVVKRIKGSAGDVTVDFLTKPKTARPWTDYRPRTGKLQWKDGDTTPKVVQITVNSDGEPEGPEHFQFILTNPRGCSLATPQKTKIIISPNTKSEAGESEERDLAMTGLSRALGDPGLTWFTSVLAPWRKTTEAPAGPDQPAAAAWAHSDAPSWLQTEVEGPGTLGYRWSLDSGRTSILLLLVDGKATPLAPTGGPWLPGATRLPPGWHTVRWVYIGGPSGSGAACLDRVRWQSSSPTAP